MRRNYTPEEDEIVIREARAGKKPYAISKLLKDRTRNSVMQRLHVLRKRGLVDIVYKGKRDSSKPKSDKMVRKQRKCLRCQKMFKSEWIGNRMCFDCKVGKRPRGSSMVEHHLSLGRFGR